MQLNQAVKQLNSYSHTATIRHSGISFVGSVINGILGIVYFFYLASKLSPDNFGRFSIAVGLITIGFSIFNFGLDQSIVKFKSDLQILANILFTKITIALIVAISILIIFGSDNLFGLVGLGIGAQLLFSLSVSFLQSWQRYYSWAGIFIATNLFRLLASVYLPSINPIYHLIIYISLPFMGFIVFYLIYFSSLPKPSFQFSVFKKLFQFNAHLSVNSIFSAITAKLDSFFIAGFQSFAVAGVYSLASQLASSVSQLTSAYSAVISPKFSSLDTPAKNTQYLKKNLIFSSVISLLLIPGILLTGYLLFTLSGNNFSQAFIPLLLLLLGMSIFFASIPMRDSLLYFYGDAKIFSRLSGYSLLFSVFTGFIFIRPFGPPAAATSFLVIQIISVIILVNRYVSQNRRSHRS